jgi:DNA-damage-inducible protein J
MSKTIQIRVDETLKSNIEELFSSLGLDISTAVRMFFSAALREQGLPFEVHRYNEETIQAIEDAMVGRDLYGPFHTAEEAIESMLMDEEDVAHRYIPPWTPPLKKVAEESDAEYHV